MDYRKMICDLLKTADNRVLRLVYIFLSELL